MIGALRKCINCENEKELSEFYNKPKHVCKVCVRNRTKNLYVHKQHYEITQNGHVGKVVDITDVNFQELPPTMPSLRESEGNVVAVGFPSGKAVVSVKSESGITNFDAKPEEVEEALNIRKQNVRALGVFDGKKSRLLKIAPASTPRFKMTDDAIEEHIFKRWNGVFARLAK